MALGSIILPAPYLQIETLPSIMRTLSCHKQSFRGGPSSQCWPALLFYSEAKRTWKIRRFKFDAVFHKLLRCSRESSSFSCHLANRNFTFYVRSKTLARCHISQLAVVEIDVLMERFQMVLALHLDGLSQRTPWHKVWKVNQMRRTLKQKKGTGAPFPFHPVLLLRRLRHFLPASPWGPL